MPEETVSSSRLARMRVHLPLMLALALVLGLPGVSAAAVLTYYPSGSSSGDNDVDDLDHRNFYVWRISSITNIPSGQEITAATLTFTRTYNFDGNANELFIQLLDNALTSGGSLLQSASVSGYNTAVRYSQDETADQGPLSDVFNNNAAITCAGLSGAALTTCQNKQTTEQTQENTLVAAGTGELFLTSRSFAALGELPTTFPGEPNPPGWTVSPDGSSNGEPLYTYTYTFTAGQVDKLAEFIANGNNVAIGLDPDCHIFNKGISLTLTTEPPSVPEPVSLTLLGTGLAFLARRRWQQRAGQPAVPCVR